MMTVLAYLLVVEWSEEDQVFIGSWSGNYCRELTCVLSIG